jgi:hypothetical protein
VVERLSSKCDTLSSNPSVAKKKIQFNTGVQRGIDTSTGDLGSDAFCAPFLLSNLQIHHETSVFISSLAK